MANHTVRTYHWPPVIPDQRFNRNGMTPNAALLRRVADTFNFVAARQKKHIASFCQPINSPSNLASGTYSYFWPTYFRTGEATTKLRVCLGWAPTSDVVNGTWNVHLVNMDTLADDAKDLVFYAGTGVASYPNGYRHIQLVFDVSPNTEYKTYNIATGGPVPIYMSIAEDASSLADDSVTAVCNPGAFVAEGPIYDSHVQDLIDANNKLWRHNGSHLISYIGFYDFSVGGSTTAFTAATASTTYVNASDLASTTVTSSTVGHKLFTTYHATTNRTTIPVKMAVQVDRTAGAGTCDVRFTDGTNSIVITGIGDNGTDTWATTTGTIPVQSGTKWDLQFRVSVGTTTFRIKGASLFEYET